MTTNPARSALAKLNRAKEHLDKFEDDLMADCKLYGFRVEDDTKTRECVVICRMPNEKIDRHGIQAGEIVSQIRSSIEHVIWQLVPAPNKKTGLPVALQQSDYQGEAGRKIVGINNAAAAIIEGLQPFNNGGATSELYILNELWNWDKHRLLYVIGIESEWFQRVYTPAPADVTGEFLHQAPPYLEDGAEILRVSHPDFYRPPEVKMYVTIRSTFKFRDSSPGAGLPAIELLRRLLKFGESVVNSLARTV